MEDGGVKRPLGLVPGVEVECKGAGVGGGRCAECLGAGGQALAPKMGSTRCASGPRWLPTGHQQLVGGAPPPPSGLVVRRGPLSVHARPISICRAPALSKSICQRSKLPPVLAESLNKAQGSSAGFESSASSDNEDRADVEGFKLPPVLAESLNNAQGPSAGFESSASSDNEDRADVEGILVPYIASFEILKQ